VAGAVGTILGKGWFGDRLVWLSDEISAKNPQLAAWLR
jgi:hypothetical protein